jgi:ATP-dependent Clp protease adaptor protein ClpS
MAIDIEEIVNVDKTTNEEFKEPGKYKVVVYNDDFTTMEFVVLLLITIFKHTQESAMDLTQRIHHEGKAVAGIYRFEIAEQKVLEATNLSRANSFPLVIRAIPE